MKIIDLSHTVGNQTPPYPGDAPLALTQERWLEADHYNAFSLRGGLHVGTHVDMPMHMLDDARTADRFPIGRFAGPGVLLDVRGENPIRMRPEYRERISPGDMVLLYTGFDAHFGQPERYFTRHPVMEYPFAEFLLERRIGLLGMDMPSPEQIPMRIHRLLLGRDIFILENLRNLGALQNVESFELWALPLKLEAEASPVRAVALVR